MKTFNVEVSRTGYSRRTIEVKADSQEEAEMMAQEDAGNYDFSEHDADYRVEYSVEVDKS